MKQTNRTKQKSKLGFLGKYLRTQIKACIHRPNPVYTGLDLHTHAHSMCAQGCSKTLTQKHEAGKQSKNENPNSDN